jgi:hypothetical protein
MSRKILIVAIVLLSSVVALQATADPPGVIVGVQKPLLPYQPQIDTLNARVATLEAQVAALQKATAPPAPAVMRPAPPVGGGLPIEGPKGGPVGGKPPTK